MSVNRLPAHSPTLWRKLQSWDSLFSADSIEFCPVPPYQHVFLCGTYQLTEAKEEDSSPKSGSDKRKGTLLLFHLNETEEQFHLIRTIETSAILDIKWSHCRVQDKIVFGIVNAIGQLVVYELVDSSTPDHPLDLNILELCSHQLDRGEASEVLALSLDWSSRNLTSEAENSRCLTKNSDDARIVVSDSRGEVHLFVLSEGGLSLQSSWKGHGFEAWIAAFNYAQPTTFYSGGDDCLLKVYDSRQSNPVQILREHEAGVTSIQYNPYTEHSLATGSYDEHLYIWDDRHMKFSRTKTNLGGGVWRIKHQSESSLLTATMYNGFHHVQWESRRERNIVKDANIGDRARGDSEIEDFKDAMDDAFKGRFGDGLNRDRDGLRRDRDSRDNTDEGEDENSKNRRSLIDDAGDLRKNQTSRVNNTPKVDSSGKTLDVTDIHSGPGSTWGSDGNTTRNCNFKVEGDVRVLHYNGHGSIAYGVDSCLSNPKYVVTCSFYDHLIHLSVLD